MIVLTWSGKNSPASAGGEMNCQAIGLTKVEIFLRLCYNKVYKQRMKVVISHEIEQSIQVQIVSKC